MINDFGEENEVVASKGRRRTPSSKSVE